MVWGGENQQNRTTPSPKGNEDFSGVQGEGRIEKATDLS
jgi:hypothetical protein